MPSNEKHDQIIFRLTMHEIINNPAFRMQCQEQIAHYFMNNGTLDLLEANAYAKEWIDDMVKEEMSKLNALPFVSILKE